jgi:hypothetical protein
LIDNDTTRVTQWRFAPGAQTGWHRHEYLVCELARDSCICWHDPMKNREQARSHKFAAPSGEAPSERLITTVVDFCSVI